MLLALHQLIGAISLLITNFPSLKKINSINLDFIGNPDPHASLQRHHIYVNKFT